MKRLIKAYPTVCMMLTFLVMSCVFAYSKTLVKVSFGVASFVFGVISFAPLALRRLYKGDRDGRMSAVLISAAITLAAFVSLYAFDVRLGRLEAVSGQTERVTLYIRDAEREYPNIAYYNAVIEESTLVPKGDKIIFITPVTGIENGSIVECEVTFAPLNERDTSIFDGKRYYLPKNVMLFAEAETVDKIGVEERFSITEFFDGIREKMASAVRAHCGKESGALTATVLLGSNKGLDLSVKRDFKRLGISHLLVISGTHFAVIIVMLEFVLRRLRVARNLRAFVNIAVALFFMGLTGFTPSVMRAGIMHIAAQLAMIVLRKPNPVNAYALSGAVMLLINPYWAIDISFQLSYASALGCIIYFLNRGEIRSFFPCRPKSGRGIFRRLFSYAAESMLVTLTVTMFTLPFSWVYFGEISLVSLPANIIAVPIITVLMILGGIYLITFPLGFIALPLAKLIDCLGGFILFLAEKAAEMGGVTLRIDYQFTPFIIAAIVVLLFVFPFAKRKRVFALSSVLLFVLMISLSILSLAIDSRNTYFSYVSLGKNEGFVLNTGGKTVIADISNASFTFSYELLTEAASHHSTEIEAIVLTHYHNKHISYFGNLCEREVVRNIVLPEPDGKTERAIYNGLCEAALEYGVAVVTLSPDDSYYVSGAEVRIYPREYLSRSSHPVSGIFVGIGEDELMLLPGSFAEGNERIDEDILHAEYVMVGDHSPICKSEFTVHSDGSLKSLVISENAAGFLSDGTDDDIKEKVVVSDSLNLKWSK